MSKALQTQIDKAVSLADTEIGLQPSSFSLQTSPGPSPQPPVSTPGGLPVAPTHAVPPTPPPEPISVAAYTERIRAGWVPVMGLPGTPITSGFVRDLGEYNPKLEGLNGIWTYQEMRRGDGQVAGTLRACKLPILSAKWEIVHRDAEEFGTRDTGYGTRDTGIRGTGFAIGNFQLRRRPRHRRQGQRSCRLHSLESLQRA